ncbi:MAG: dolichyl-phosphate-mannose--protein mannosyltransferase [Actinomycetota bacterium]
MEADTRTADGTGETTSTLTAGPTSHRGARGASAWWSRPVVILLAVTALAAGLRFYHVSAPHEYVFDEVYYAKDACFLAGFPFRQCKLQSPNEQSFTVHPPLGRWIIAGGEAAFGNRPFGWRFASAVFGTLSVLLTALLAYVLFGSGAWAGVAGLLLATESLNFVQSRTSMLDIILTAFVVAGFLCIALDRWWMERRTPPSERSRDAAASSPAAPPSTLPPAPPDEVPSPIFRPWRLAAGLAFGAAVATKWSGALALLGGLVLAIGWEITRRRRARLAWGQAIWQTVRDEGFGIFLFVILVPLAVYIASYARYFASEGVHPTAWLKLQVDMANFSLDLRATHPYASRPWTWPLLIRPVSYFYKGTGTGPTATSAEILGMGNPAVFWGGLMALVWTGIAWIGRRDWRGALIVVAFAAQYFPWFAVARTAFLFYMTPMTPFLVLAGTYGVRDLWEARIGNPPIRALAPLAVLLVVTAVGMFAFFFPILTGRTIPYDAWHTRMWFRTWI